MEIKEDEESICKGGEKWRGKREIEEGEGKLKGGKREIKRGHGE